MLTHPLLLAALVLAVAAPSQAAPTAEGAAHAGASLFLQAIETPVIASLATSRPEDRLLELLDDQDASVRAEAAKTLRHYAQTDHRVKRRLEELLEDGRQPDEVRRECAKSLAWAAQDRSTADRILAVARDRRLSDGLRAAAFKSLYVAAGLRGVTDALRETLADGRETVEVRSAAAWALGHAAAEHDARRALIGTAQDRTLDASLRREAVKSLFHGLASNYDAENAVRALAEDAREPVEIREAAILELILKNQDRDAREFLDRTTRSQEPRLRAAAIKALGGLTLELARFFHLSHWHGRFIDPLEDQ